MRTSICVANSLGEMPSCYGTGLEPLFEDYALALLVWSQQSANAEQIRAITIGVIKEPHELGSCGSFMAPTAGLEPATT